MQPSEVGKFNIKTLSGKYIDLKEPKVESVDLVDMANALGNIARFLGHTRSPVTVLEHLINCYERACALTNDPRVQYAALMHDAHESYVCDVPTPLKKLIGAPYMEIEDNWQKAVFDWAGIPIELADHPVVKQADIEMLVTEARDFHGVTEEELGRYWPDVKPLDYFLDRWNIAAARKRFCNLVIGFRTELAGLQDATFPVVVPAL